MALLQISEPGESTSPHEHRLAVGIDLGTTNSLVATVRSGVADTIADESGNHLLSSVVRYRAQAEPEVGSAAQSQSISDPLNTIVSVKRLMGRGVEDIRHLGNILPYEFVAADSDMPYIRTAAGDRSPVQVSSEILKVLKLRAEAVLGGDLTGAVVTVPAYFDDAQRQATKDAARLAGLHVFRLLNEPTAAAVAYGLDQKPEGIYAIYDLGGGTFDISILQLHRGVFEVLATAGNSALGGDDMDHVIAEWIMQQSGIDHGADRSLLRRLMQEGRRVKETLTQENCTVASIQSGDINWQGELTRAGLVELIDPLIDGTLLPCRRVMRDAGIKVNDIEGVVLVGGSTRVRRVRERVETFFGKPPLSDIDPDRVVAIGAALQANILAGNKPKEKMLLLDITPLSLGIEIMGGMTEKIIPRNSAIPIAKAQEFTTFKDGQTAMSIHVVQGEREMVGDCRSLARFELRGFPPLVAGAARIRVTYQVDADGLMSVTAREQTSGVEAHVEVKPSYGLSDGEIETMLRESFSHAHEDMDARNLREAQVDADRIIENVTAALAADGDELLSAGERKAILLRLGELEAVRHGDEVKKIERAISETDKVTQEFAARRMDAGMQKALTGHKLSEFTSEK
ncbi:MAG: Fe-S protein assembly chaperone HscA [Acidiferrobacterales bacterium]